jgi:hypothetical protein
VTHSVARLVFNVELEIKYDPFKGRTVEEFGETVHDDIADVLFELREKEMLGVFTDLVKAEVINPKDEYDFLGDPLNYDQTTAPV